MEIKLSDPILVYAPKVTEENSRWGVYAIPRMWREPNGDLVIRFNGEADSADTENMFCAPNLYFVSKDNGRHWQPDEKGEKKHDISVLTGIDAPYLKCKNGDTLFLQYKKDALPLKGVPHQKEFVMPNREAIVRAYRYGDIPSECKGISLGRISAGGEASLEKITFDFPEREVLINNKALSENGFIPVEEYIQPYIFKSPYFSSLKEAQDGTLMALATGQNSAVSDHFSSEVYLLSSTDGGKTFTKRSTVASAAEGLPYGYGGDGGEVSLAIDKNGDLHVVMRMDMSLNPNEDTTKVWSTYYTASHDGGYTWAKPREIADSSVTPHILTLGDVLIVIYGRPGVHLIYSTDKGKNWSDSISIIGKTLSEERADGRSDFDSKFGESISYSNTFVEKISESEAIVCYNDLTYPDENGIPTKAAFVRRIGIL